MPAAVTLEPRVDQVSQTVTFNSFKDIKDVGPRIYSPLFELHGFKFSICCDPSKKVSDSPHPPESSSSSNSERTVGLCLCLQPTSADQPLQVKFQLLVDHQVKGRFFITSLAHQTFETTMGGGGGGENSWPKGSSDFLKYDDVVSYCLIDGSLRVTVVMEHSPTLVAPSLEHCPSPSALVHNNHPLDSWSELDEHGNVVMLKITPTSSSSSSSSSSQMEIKEMDDESKVQVDDASNFYTLQKDRTRAQGYACILLTTIQPATSGILQFYHQDYLKLQAMMYEIKCDFEVHVNTTGQQTADALVEFSTRDFSNYDYAMLIVIGNGSSIDAVQLEDKGSIPVSNGYIHSYMNSESLSGKPKVVLIQGSRPTGAPSRDFPTHGCFEDKFPCQTFYMDRMRVGYCLAPDLHRRDDYFIMRSSTLGTDSWCHTEHGSWLIEAISKEFMKSHSTKDMHTMLTNVSVAVARRCATVTEPSPLKFQVPELMCTATRKFRLSTSVSE